MLQPDSSLPNQDAVQSATVAESMNRKWPTLRRSLQVGLSVGLLMALILIFLPNHYKSEARVLPGDSRGAGGMAVAAAAAAGVSIPGSDGPDAVYMDILNSRSLREALLQTRFRFKVRTWLLGREQVREQTLYEYLKKKNLDRAVQALRDRITITRDFKSKLLTLVADTESPELSQQVVQQLVRLLDEFVVTKSRTRGGAKAAFAEKRLHEARQEMAQAEEALRAFLDGNRNYLLSPDPAVRLKGQRLDNELKLRTQLLATLAIAREQALLEEKNDMPILSVLDPGNLPIEKSGPARTIIVILASLLAGLGTVTWLNREWIRAWLAADDMASSPEV